MTDSVLVPRGKGEKNPNKGSEIEPAIVCLHTVGGLCFFGSTPDRVPFV